MIVRKLKLKKGGAQQQLATLTDLNVRTIQRIEQGQTPSLESKRAFAAVFEVGIEVFEKANTPNQSDPEGTMNKPEMPRNKTYLNDDETLAIQYAKSISEFYTHLLMFVIFVPIIAISKGVTDPQTLTVIGGWTMGIVLHGLVAYEKITIFTPNWERKLAEKKLGRKL